MEKKKTKIGVSTLSDKDLKKIGDMNLIIAKNFYSLNPFTTKTFMALKTKISMSFIINNWDEITK